MNLPMELPVAIGIDLGGTMIKGVLLQQDGKILDQIEKPTNDSGNVAIFNWQESIKTSCGRAEAKR